MESIEKLREAFEKCTYPIKDEMIELDTVWIPRVIAMAMLDDIEAEIERDYMKMPVDADGVPIHIGDICTKLDERFEVRQLRTDGDAWWTIDRLGESYMANFCHHAKQRTLEDVLRDFIAAYDEWDDNAVDDRMERRDELFAKYADEIRELLEVM